MATNIPTAASIGGFLAIMTIFLVAGSGAGGVTAYTSTVAKGGSISSSQFGQIVYLGLDVSGYPYYWDYCGGGTYTVHVSENPASSKIPASVRVCKPGEDAAHATQEINIASADGSSMTFETIGKTWDLTNVNIDNSDAQILKIASIGNAGFAVSDFAAPTGDSVEVNIMGGSECGAGCLLTFAKLVVKDGAGNQIPVQLRDTGTRTYLDSNNFLVNPSTVSSTPYTFSIKPSVATTYQIDLVSNTGFGKQSSATFTIVPAGHTVVTPTPQPPTTSTTVNYGQTVDTIYDGNAVKFGFLGIVELINTPGKVTYSSPGPGLFVEIYEAAAMKMSPWLKVGDSYTLSSGVEVTITSITPGMISSTKHDGGTASCAYATGGSVCEKRYQTSSSTMTYSLSLPVTATPTPAPSSTPATTPAPTATSTKTPTPATTPTKTPTPAKTPIPTSTKTVASSGIPAKVGTECKAIKGMCAKSCSSTTRVDNGKMDCGVTGWFWKVQTTCCTKKPCSDGTPQGSCSTVNKPKYCNTAAKLVDLPSKCPCPVGLVKKYGKCVAPAPPRLRSK